MSIVILEKIQNVKQGKAGECRITLNPYSLSKRNGDYVWTQKKGHAYVALMILRFVIRSLVFLWAIAALRVLEMGFNFSVVLTETPCSEDEGFIDLPISSIGVVSIYKKTIVNDENISYMNI